jgi:hypothetical protein
MADDDQSSPPSAPPSADSEPLSSRLADLEEQLPGWNQAPEGGELVYVKVRWLDGDQVVDWVEEGALSDEALQRVARPWTYRDDPWVYDEEVAMEQVDGYARHIYRVVRHPNASHDVEQPENLDSAGPVIDEEVWELAALALQGELAYHEGTTIGPGELVLALRARDFPEWNAPLRLRSQFATPEEVEAVEAQRALLEATMLQTLRERLAHIIDRVDEAGGQILAEYPQLGWIGVRVPADLFPELAEDPSLSRIHSATASEPESIEGWRLGDGRDATRLDAQRFIDAGYDGSYLAWFYWNGSWIPYTAYVRVAITESRGYNDEACMFYATSDCTGANRIVARWRCDGTPACESISDFPDSSGQDHGTLSASVAVGDYTNGQGCGQELGDPNWTSGCHSADWEQSRTGMAPRARVILAGLMHPDHDRLSFAGMFNRSVESGADVISGSWMNGTKCNIASNHIHESYLELAYDEGGVCCNVFWEQEWFLHV